MYLYPCEVNKQLKSIYGMIEDEENLILSSTLLLRNYHLTRNMNSLIFRRQPKSLNFMIFR